LQFFYINVLHTPTRPEYHNNTNSNRYGQKKGSVLGFQLLVLLDAVVSERSTRFRGWRLEDLHSHREVVVVHILLQVEQGLNRPLLQIL
jgi:hypothetical protein